MLGHDFRGQSDGLYLVSCAVVDGCCGGRVLALGRTGAERLSLRCLDPRDSYLAPLETRCGGLGRRWDDDPSSLVPPTGCATNRVGRVVAWCSRSRSSVSRRWLWLSDIAEIAQVRSRLGPRPGMMRLLLAG